MAKLFLVRHAEPKEAWGAGGDPGLSRFGRNQAEYCAQQLVDLGQMKIVSAPSKRAQETAAPAAILQRQNVILEPRIGEVQPPAGLSDVQAWMVDNFSTTSKKTWRDMDQRMHAWRDGVLAAVRAVKTDTAMFTHFVPINVIVGEALRVEETCMSRPDFASITEFAVENGDIRLVINGAPIGDGRPG
ncbi:MAG: histidine phosphatase family protein [Terricaulis sp.]